MIALVHEHTPHIGISGSNADSASVQAMATQIQDAGGIPVFLGNHSQRNALDDLAKVDAIVVLGNNADIDPARYGAKPDPHTQSELATPEGRARAAYEEELLRGALDRHMPILGVCGGMQRLNVLLGGSLHQHVPDLVGDDHHAQQQHDIAPSVAVQSVEILPGTALALTAAGTTMLFTPAHGETPQGGRVLENSMHHQSLDKLGAGLRAAAISQDGIIEAVEADPLGPLREQQILAVQWHPEFGVSPLGPKLIEKTVEGAAHFAKTHHRHHPLDEAIAENIKSGYRSARLGGEHIVAPATDKLRFRTTASEERNL